MVSSPPIPRNAEQVQSEGRNRYDGEKTAQVKES
jgi:hypothetical protein